MLSTPTYTKVCRYMNTIIIFYTCVTDPNHKPEMALAITPFEALCGFRPLSEIANFLNNTPELHALIPPSIVNNFLLVSGSNPTEPAEKAALKSLFESLMTTDESIFHHQLVILVKRYQSQVTKENDIVQLVLKLNDQFPGDIGSFCPFLLNYVRLDPGQAIFLGAGEPHAYISGGKLYYPYFKHFSSSRTTHYRLHRMYGQFRQRHTRGINS